MLTFGGIRFEARRCGFVHVVDLVLVVGNFAREAVMCVLCRVRVRARVRARDVIRVMVMVFLMLYLHFCHGRTR